MGPNGRWESTKRVGYGSGTVLVRARDGRMGRVKYPDGLKTWSEVMRGWDFFWLSDEPSDCPLIELGNLLTREVYR
jgi:hypothetical protein